jgi:glycerate kinase
VKDFEQTVRQGQAIIGVAEPSRERGIPLVFICGWI